MYLKPRSLTHSFFKQELGKSMLERLSSLPPGMSFRVEQSEGVSLSTSVATNGYGATPVWSILPSPSLNVDGGCGAEVVLQLAATEHVEKCLRPLLACPKNRIEVWIAMSKVFVGFLSRDREVGPFSRALTLSLSVLHVMSSLCRSRCCSGVRYRIQL